MAADKHQQIKPFGTGHVLCRAQHGLQTQGGQRQHVDLVIGQSCCKRCIAMCGTSKNHQIVHDTSTTLFVHHSVLSAASSLDRISRAPLSISVAAACSPRRCASVTGPDASACITTEPSGSATSARTVMSPLLIWAYAASGT